MSDFFKKSANIAFGIFSCVMTIVPETLFRCIKLFKALSDDVNVIFNRIIVLLVIYLLSMGVYKIWISVKWWRVIKGKNYKIKVRYGDIFNVKNCKKVIPFDECYTTKVGDMPGDIKSNSICGQFLLKHPISNMQELINHIQLKPKGKSKHQNKDKYESGRVIPHQDYLLLSFAKLDKEGLGRMTRVELLECLAVLWNEIDKNYGQKDVCIPILGSGITRMDDSALQQQELLDIIIASYKLSASKIKKPNKLVIVCRRSEDFSLQKIGKYI